MVTLTENNLAGYRLRGRIPDGGNKKCSQKADLTSRVFGRLTVIENLGAYKSGFRLWGCLCECGERVAVRSRELNEGDTKSCGCLNRQLAKVMGGLNRKETGESSFNQLLYNYKKSATKRGYKFCLSEDEFRHIVEQECFYCGSFRSTKAARAKGTNGDYFYTGCDRVNNEGDYTLDNVKPCCKQCNIAKNVLSETNFFNWINMVTNKHKKRNP